MDLDQGELDFSVESDIMGVVSGCSNEIEISEFLDKIEPLQKQNLDGDASTLVTKNLKSKDIVTA